MNTINTNSLHDFTQDDWYAFAGASNLPDGSSPLIADLNAWAVIVCGDDNGAVCVEFLKCDAESAEAEIWNLRGCLKQNAIAIANAALATKENFGAEEFFADFNFVRIN